MTPWQVSGALRWPDCLVANGEEGVWRKESGRAGGVSTEKAQGFGPSLVCFAQYQVRAETNSLLDLDAAITSFGNDIHGRIRLGNYPDAGS